MRHLEVTDSSTIKSIAYDYDTMEGGTLEVIFKASPDTVYIYPDVGVTRYIALVNAESIGVAFDKLFKKTKHPFTKSQRAPTLKK